MENCGEKLSKKIELMLLLVAGFLLTSHKPLTPLPYGAHYFPERFSDNGARDRPNEHLFAAEPWRTRPIVIAGVVLGLLRLVFTLGVFAIGYYALQFDTPHLQSLTFAAIIFGSQAGVFLLRERGHCWCRFPAARWS